ncbi:hypothetical protein Holit_01187 [Hollandina sp. SP2]
MIRTGLLMLSFWASLAFIGCESSLGPAAEATGLDTDRAAGVRISGPLEVMDRGYAVLYQGSPWYIDGLSDSDLVPGSTLTVTGEARPLLGQDEAGNSLFYGYYLYADAGRVN